MALIGEYYHLYYLENKEKIKARTGKYQSEHRDWANKKHKEWARKHPDRIKIIQKRYEEKNKSQIQARRRRYYYDNRERILKRDRINQRIANLRLKVEVLSYYGEGMCRCCICGVDNIDCLSLDHKSNNGYEHRKVLRSNSIYRFVKSKDYPKGYQTLCMNCQWIKKAIVQRQRRLPSRS